MLETSGTCKTPILEGRSLTKCFRTPAGGVLRALDGAAVTLFEGEILGVVGESGCGKSTLARLLCGLDRPDGGEVRFSGRSLTELCELRGEAFRTYRRSVQMVFQQPFASFDPRLTLGESAEEALLNLGVPALERERRIEDLFERCGLSPELARRYPSEVSGGQCQRAALARALAPEPRVLVCDEMTSALDVITQRRVLDLVRGIARERALAVLLITHDLALVHAYADRVLVMDAGRTVETGPVASVIDRPQSDAARRLREASLD